MPRHVDPGKTAGRRRESTTKQLPDAFEYDETVHGADPVVSSELPDGTTEAEALDMTIAEMEDAGVKVRKVVHPADPRAGPVADRPVVNLR